MVVTREFHMLPAAKLLHPAKMPMPHRTGLSFPAATIYTSLRWQRLLASQTHAMEENRRLRIAPSSRA